VTSRLERITDILLLAGMLLATFNLLVR